MGIFHKRKSEEPSAEAAGVSVQTGSLTSHPFRSLGSYYGASRANAGVYRALREGVPIIDSAIYKIVRLIGGFTFVTGDEKTDRQMQEFFEMINVGGNRTGISAFLDTYTEQLLTYGTAIGEMLYDANGFYALYNGALESLELRRSDDALSVDFYNISNGTPKKLTHSERLLLTVLNPEPEGLYGTSLLRGLPFVSDILLKIFASIGNNWERVGNLRYAVTYVPQGDSTDKAFARERANQMAQAWREAMSSKESIKDFVAVGDVKVSVIGADNQVLDSDIPVRQMLEQIIAKTGLMPYMFGLNWSTSERMAKQQMDILTTELEAYRRLLTPVLKKIAGVYLNLYANGEPVEVVWDDITLQDETELAKARLYNVQADKLLKEVDA